LDITQTALDGVVILAPKRFGDDRGYFSEVWNRQTMAAAGFDIDFVQDNHSLSAQVGTLRGLHYQSPPHAQDKLVRCGAGSLLDVAVDIRRSSPTYGQHVAVELSAANGLQLLVPKGFLHGFVTLRPNTEVLYKCSDFYAADCDGSVHFEGFGIDWGIDPNKAVLSQKDANAVAFDAFVSPFE